MVRGGPPGPQASLAAARHHAGRLSGPEKLPLASGETNPGLNVAGVSANPLDIVLGAAILIAMIVNVRLARVRAAGRN